MFMLLTKQIRMSFEPGTQVLLLANVQGGQIGDECIVASSGHGWVKVTLVGMNYNMNVRAHQIQVKQPVQLSMFDRWAD